jgi:hypothetical protein
MDLGRLAPAPGIRVTKIAGQRDETPPHGWILVGLLPLGASF